MLVAASDGSFIVAYKMGVVEKYTELGRWVAPIPRSDPLCNGLGGQRIKSVTFDIHRHALPLP